LEISATASIRPRVHGKFIFAGNEKLHVCGVTYGTFCLDEDGNEYLDPEVVERDFAQMAANGLNAVLSTGAALDHAWTASAILGMVAMLLALHMLLECANTIAAVLLPWGAYKKGEA
jgi:hypothetical protein